MADPSTASIATIIVALLGKVKQVVVTVVHFFKTKLLIEFSDSAPFRLYENDEFGIFAKQHYAIRVKNNMVLKCAQDGLRVQLTDIKDPISKPMLPIELRYKDRSDRRNKLNPKPDFSTVAVLSFEIDTSPDRDGFFIVFHGDDGTDYSMPYSPCRIRIDVSSSEQNPIPQWFELGMEKHFFMKPIDSRQ